jgi:hypothetical protein
MKLIADKKLTTKEWLFGLSNREVEKFPRLHKVLLRIFSCVPSSAACERNFSGFGYLNTKLRNRLHKPKLRMLGYIYSNSRALKLNNYDPFEEEDENAEEVIEGPVTPTNLTLDFNGFANIDIEYEQE